MPSADNTPDFDKMTPEEIMAWMESLAKRQGADAAQFTTSANVEIAEIDPDSVVIDEPGYVPSEGKMKGKKIESIYPSKTAAPKPEAPSAAPPVVQQPAAAAAAPPVAAAPTPIQKQPEPEPSSGLSWLESLAADQGGDFPSLDLSSIAADLAPVSTPPAEPATTNPVDWLESLAQSQGVEDAAPVQAEPSAEAANPVSWMESLAKRQGAPDEELTTPADLDVPMPAAASTDGPGYTDYTFEMPDSGPKQPEPHAPAAPSPVPAQTAADLQDPAAWLDALATSQGVSEPKATEAQLSDDEIQKALARGEVVPHDQMEAWMNRQLEIGAQREEPEELTAYDPDAPAVKAEIPDWLIEQVGTAPPEEVTQTLAPVAPLPPSGPAFSESIVEPPAVADMPDWLKEEAPSHSELENIFAPTPTEIPAPAAASAPPPTIEIDPNDPWVEALEMEYAQGKGENIPLPEMVTPAPAVSSPAALQETTLQPETELPAGEPEPVPDWLHDVVTSAAETDAVADDIPGWLLVDIGAPSASEQPAVAGDMPDWLQSVDVEASEVPSWLTETLGTSTEQAPSVSEPALVVTPPAPVPAPRLYSPAPIPAKVLNIDVPATLNAARTAATSNDVDGCLQNYEMLIRANAELEAVVGDLAKLAEKIKTYPAVYRVLGDGLMRQGNLQAALDIYRKALNQL